MVGLLTALPDTQLWRRLKAEGRLLAESSGENTNAELNFVPRMDAAKLIEGYRSIIRNIYSSKEYYGRALECLKRVSGKSADPVPNKLGIISGTRALMRITVRLGILDRERREFWRFFLGTFVHHRDAFAMSMRLAAMGYHFRRLAEAGAG